MLKPIPWANSLAITAAIFYAILWVVSATLPTMFALIFNAQFLGADIASLYSIQDLTTALVSLVVLSVSTWIIGYVWAYIYNQMAGK